MKFEPLELPGVILAIPDVHRDARGFFVETYQRERYREAGIDAEFVQDNHSRSARGTLRGLHLQLERPQAKLVRVSAGSVYDVAVDVRRGSPHFGRYVGVELSAENMHQLYIPTGFAHGFLVTSDTAEFQYKCSDYYDPASEITVAWNDPEIGIAWPVSEPSLSAKDAEAPTLAQSLDRLPAYRA